MDELIIRGQLDGLNDYTKACRANRYVGNKMKKDNQDYITIFIREQMSEERFERVAIRFNWFEPNRRRDPDNIAFAKKFILDALVNEGVLRNDSQRYIEHFEDYFYVDANNPRVEVWFTEIED